MTITVLDGRTLNPGDNPWEPIEALGDLVVHDGTPPERVVERARGSEIVLTNKTPLSRDTLAQLPGLRYIGVLATGYNVVDVSAAAEAGVVVTNVPEYGTDSVAQHTIALLLTLIHDPRRHDEAVRAGAWRESGEFSFWLTPLAELAGKTLGVVGYGRIGRKVGQIARALGMTVIASSRTRPAEDQFDDGTEWAEVDGLFAQSDVVSLHCPQTPENAGFVNQRLLARMKPTALLINTARGGLVDEADLAAALADGTLAGAALDVVSAEPVDPSNALLWAPNVLLTPHMAWAAVEARRRLMRIAAGNVASFLAGRPQNVVNG